MKLYKAVIDAGMSCPNIDGKKGFGGCIYCDGGAGYFTGEPTLSVETQLKKELERIRRKVPGASAIAYFQAHTNTYAPTERLRELFECALSTEGIYGLSIATRADALEPETLDYLSELNTRTYLTVELGLQTVSDMTAEKINRCHSYQEFITGYNELKKRNIRTCVHLINGLPGEAKADMLNSAVTVGKLLPAAVKLHMLHVIRGTVLEKMYLSGEYTPLTLDEYSDIIVTQLEHLPSQTVIERVTGDGDKRCLTAPLWSRDKIRVLGTIDKLFAERDTWQGRCFCPEQ